MIKKLLSFFDKNEKKSLVKLLSFILMMGVLEVAGVLSVAPFIALAANPKLIYQNEKVSRVYNALHFHSANHFLIFVGFSLLIFFLFNNAFSSLTTWKILRFSAEQNHRLSTKLFSVYLYKPYHYFLKKNTSDLSKNILDECTAVAEGVILPMMQGLSKAVSIFLICALLVIVSPLLALLVATTFGGAYVAIYMIFYRRLGQYGRARLDASTERYKISSEAFGAIKAVKAKGCESSFIKLFSDAAERFATMMVRNQLITQLPRFLLETIAFGSILMITLYLLMVKSSFSQALPILALYALAGYRLMPSLQQLYLALTTVRFKKPVVDLLYEDLQQANEINIQQQNNIAPLPFVDKVTLENVHFSYDKSEAEILSDINITIKKGRSVAFVGETGAGKTTIVDLILGLFEPSSGGVFVDGTQITEVNKRQWQNNISYIPQDIFLCDGTVAQNIAFGVPSNEIDLDAVVRAAKIANCHDFISSQLPGQYHTVVGEKGVRLSGGQRQRIGIARALYHDPEILVLDEATSALDNVTESAVMKAIDNIAKKKTLIMIAHRLTTVKDCDVIYLLSKGKIVDQGGYQELLTKNDMFREMAKAAKNDSEEILCQQ